MHPSKKGLCVSSHNTRHRIVRAILLIGLANAALSTSDLSGAEPAKPRSWTGGYFLQLSNGAEMQVRLSSTSSPGLRTYRGISLDLNTNHVCTFEEREDSLWWQTSLDFACGKTRLELRFESPSLTGDPPEAARVPRMVKIRLGDTLHTWTVLDNVVKDTDAAARARGEIQKTPPAFRSALGNLGAALLSPTFMVETAAAPAAFALVDDLLKSGSTPIEVASIQVLTADEMDALVRRAAADTK